MLDCVWSFLAIRELGLSSRSVLVNDIAHGCHGDLEPPSAMPAVDAVDAVQGRQPLLSASSTQTTNPPLLPPGTDEPQTSACLEPQTSACLARSGEETPSAAHRGAALPRRLLSRPAAPTTAALVGSSTKASELLKPPHLRCVNECSGCQADFTGPSFMLHDRAYCCQSHRMRALREFERGQTGAHRNIGDDSPQSMLASGVRASYFARVDM